MRLGKTQFCMVRALSERHEPSKRLRAFARLSASTWDLTFDMSGGAKGAKRPLGRPLDGGVRRLHSLPLTRVGDDTL